MKNSCIVCGNPNSVSMYPQIVRCPNCTHVYADITLSEEELIKIYKNNYFAGDEYIDYLADKKVIQKNFQLRFKTLLKYIEKSHSRSLLEIGCAYGFFLDMVKNQFDRVKGFDITDEGIRHARENLHLDVVQQDFMSVDLGNQFFDVVCLWDTIEHLQYPHLYIKKASEHMKPGSLLAITTGDIQSFNARWKKQHWRLIHPPTHLHYFSRKSLTALLEKNGFEICYSGYCGFYRSLNNMLYGIFVLKQKKPALYELTKKSRLVNFDLYLNLYDIMYVIARKK